MKWNSAGSFFIFSFIIIFTGCGGPHMNVASGPSGPNQGAGGAGITYNGQILSLFRSRCSTCHNATSAVPNWLNYQTAYAARADIYMHVYVSRDMPLNNVTGMTDAERTEVAQWINDGAPEDSSTPGSGPGPNPGPAPTPSPTQTHGKLLTQCLSCHNPGAEAVGPILVGQSQGYLNAQLKHIRSGERVVPFMNDLLKQVDDQTLISLANYFSSLSPCDYQQATPNPLNGNVERGRKINVTSCVNCHETGGVGAPKLWGQKTQYIVTQLMNFKSRARQSTFMSVTADSLSQQDMADVAAYFNSIPTCGVVRWGQDGANP